MISVQEAKGEPMSEREIIVREWHDDKGLIHRREVGQELIRCKECKYREKNHYCVKWGQPYLCRDDAFCSYGERRE